MTPSVRRRPIPDLAGGASLPYARVMEIMIPLIAGLALFWLIGRGVPWNAKLTTIVVTLAIVLLIVALERGGYWPEAFRRR